MRKAAFWTALAVTAAALAGLIAMPAAALAGAKRGLAVCVEVIVPSLLPFMILSGLLTGLGLPQLLGSALGGAFGRFFALPGAAATALILGLTGGYPVGAAALADLVRGGELTAEEASRALPFCNNTGPGFLIGAVGGAAFSSARIGALLYLSHALAALAVGLLGAIGRPRRRAARQACELSVRSLPALLPEAVGRAAASMVNICAFAVFFSVLSALLDALGLFPALRGALAVRTGLEPGAAEALLRGLLELGSGAAALRSLAPAAGNLALAGFILGFGSLSVHCQTLAAVAGTEIKTARHFAGRLLHGGFSALFVFLLFTLLRI